MTAKVALGYVLIISIMAVAVWLVGGNSRVLTQASEAERMYAAAALWTVWFTVICRPETPSGQYV